MPVHCFQCGAELQAHYKACPICGDQVSEFVRAHLDRPIEGKYEIVSRLGVGGMGEVYKVRHIHLNSIRVLKLMRPNITGTKGAQERFTREAQLATLIQHPNVATLHDFAALPDGTYYMIWEYIEGKNLANLIREKGALSARQAATISIDALLGLDAIHQIGVVHRDVSPENIMLTGTASGEQRVKIIDLGIAKQWDSKSGATETGMFVGKWKYCSPEHLGVLEEGEHIDGRADIYSFGIVLYEMLAGRPPFEAETPHQYVVMHAHTAPKPLPREKIGNPELEHVILRAMEKDRTKRFPTARAFAEELRAIVPILPDTTLPVGEASAAAVASTELTGAPAAAPTQLDATAVSVSAAPIAPTAVATALPKTEMVMPPPFAASNLLTPDSVALRGDVTPVVRMSTLGIDRESIKSRLRDFLRTPIGKLVAIVVFLGFVGLVLPVVTTIIRWALIIAFIVFMLVASWKIFKWYRSTHPSGS